MKATHTTNRKPTNKTTIRSYRHCSDTQCYIIMVCSLVVVLMLGLLVHYIVTNVDKMDIIYTTNLIQEMDQGDEDAMSRYYNDHVEKDDYCFDTKANVVLCARKYNLGEDFVEEMYVRSCYYGNFQKFFDKIIEPYYT